MKKFDIPEYYRSGIISKLKELRKLKDPRKKDYTPSILNFGQVEIIMARHFGFCYGVENAIEIAYRTIELNPGKRIFLLSEMIHNPIVNEDLKDRGVLFIMRPDGTQLIPWEEITKDDIVLIPAFGTTVQIENRLKSIGIDINKYDTTCPFVEKVWNRAATLGEKDYTIIIHGKHLHEETRATFSHSMANSPSVIIRDIEEAKLLGLVITGEISADEFFSIFKGKYSEGFNPDKDFLRIGVVNQTTMLATETQEIADYLKSVMSNKFGSENVKEHFADTRDTLCYATNDNQQATYKLLETSADFAIVVGGYNSSNTSHLVELLESKFTTYFISSSEKILSSDEILSYSIKDKKEITIKGFLPKKEKVSIILTSGASCPDAIGEGVLHRILSFFGNTRNLDEVIREAVHE